MCATRVTTVQFSSHQLLAEQGIYYSVETYHMGNLIDTEDEFHFILKCPMYMYLHPLYIKTYYCS